VDTKDPEDGEEEGWGSAVMVTKKRKVAVTPMDVLQKVLGEEKFDCIREVSHLRVGEGPVSEKTSPDSSPSVGTGRGGGGSAGEEAEGGEEETEDRVNEISSLHLIH
jgi:hypothetical protein